MPNDLDGTQLRELCNALGREGGTFQGVLEEVRLLRAHAQGAPTPAARWRVEGQPDPHGSHYDGERATLCLGHLTDDEVANAVFLTPAIWNLTAAKERIRWLSRRLTSAARAFEIADVAMFELLDGEGVGIADDRIGLTDDGQSEVTKLVDSSPAIQEAFEWLHPRGYVELATDNTGEFIRVLRRPDETDTAEEARPKEKA